MPTLIFSAPHCPSRPYTADAGSLAYRGPRHPLGLACFVGLVVATVRRAGWQRDRQARSTSGLVREASAVRRDRERVLPQQGIPAVAINVVSNVPSAVPVRPKSQRDVVLALGRGLVCRPAIDSVDRRASLLMAILAAV